MSPAVAGLAAVTAAVIGARALKKQLDQTIRQFEHTESEARHTRGKDAEASWWEKFEWVTDRILPTDTKQDKLEKPLALNLLRSLQEMATADFQRAAVFGVIEHYLGPDSDDEVQRQDQSPRNIDSEVQALRALDEATKVTSGRSKVVEAAILGAEYDQKGLLALEEMGLPVQVQPRVLISETPSQGRRVVPDAILSLDGRQVAVEFRGWHRFNYSGISRVVQLAKQLKAASAADDFVLVTSADLPTRTPTEEHGHLRLVHWLADEGSLALIEKIRKALAPGTVN